KLGRYMKTTFVFSLITTLVFAMGCTEQQPRKQPSDQKYLQVENLLGVKGDRRSDNPFGFFGTNLNWVIKDADIDGMPRTSAERAYALPFVKAQVQPITVAIIDSGVDIDHEDLKDSIWTNLKELNGQPGVDDDQNGYIDDFYGWN